MLNGHAKANGHDPQPLRKPRFPLLRFDEIQLNTQRRYLVRNMIPREGLTVVWGPPKCGKSFLITDIAFHVAIGWDYRGHRVSQGSVVYVACEGQSGFDARIEALRQHRMGEEQEAPPFYLLPTRLDFVNDCDALMMDIAAQLPAGECCMIVLDTLNRSLMGSENSDEDMSGYIAACDKIKERFHCAVVVIHHCGIDGTRPRGHTSLMGALDAQIAVSRDDNGTIKALVERMKEGPEGDELLSLLNVVVVGQDEEGENITSCVVDDATQPFQAKPAAAKKPKLTAAAKVAADTLQKAVASAGHQAPVSNHIPHGTIVVTIDLWRRFHYLALGDDYTPDAKRQDFHRARQQLQAAGIAQIHGDVAWIVASNSQ